MTSRPDALVAIVTTGRQDYGIIRSTIHAARAAARFRVEVWAGGMHLHERFGRPLEVLDQDGIRPDATLAFITDPPDPARDTAQALAGFSETLRDRKPDAILLVGDRSETIAAGIAATLAVVPIVHIHGGEESEGAVDNAFRHALTKLAHLHLVTHPLYAERVIQMGEDPANVSVVGIPGADNLQRDDLPGRAELERELGGALPDPVVLVTVHPATLGERGVDETRAVAAALEAVPATYVITQPNSDHGSEAIREFWKEWATGRNRVYLADALGERRYWGLLRLAAAMIGNSSSGILEAPAAGVPVVNVGDRQRGRLRFGRVSDVPADARVVTDALRAAIGEGRSATSKRRGTAASAIVDAIAEWLPRRTARKTLHRLPATASAGATS